jgi:hypothetical protein
MIRQTPLTSWAGSAVVARGTAAIFLVFALSTTGAVLLAFVRLKHAREALVAEMLASGELELACFTCNTFLALMEGTGLTFSNAALMHGILCAIDARGGGSARRALATVTLQVRTAIRVCMAVIPYTPVVVISGARYTVVMLGVLPEILVSVSDSGRCRSGSGGRCTSNNHNTSFRTRLRSARVASVFNVVRARNIHVHNISGHSYIVSAHRHGLLARLHHITECARIFILRSGGVMNDLNARFIGIAIAQRKHGCRGGRCGLLDCFHKVYLK